MANPEHVEVVRQGAAAIAEWRKQNPGIRFDLMKADFGGEDLAGTNLSHADLSFANLVADLTNADLMSADLFRTNLDGAVLSGTNMAGAVLCLTSIGGIDLSGTRNIESAFHAGPSYISVDTLALTLRGCGGTLTTALRTFFLGAGVPDTLLTYLPSLFQQNPLQFYSCLISFATPDEPFPTKLYADLKSKGINCWKYDEDAVGGRSLRANIDRAIRIYDKVILICSEQSLNSPAVLEEIERALDKEQQLYRQKQANPAVDADVLFPITIDRYVFDGWQHELQQPVVKKYVPDFSDWQADDAKYQRQLDRLVRNLNPTSWKLGQ